MDEKPKHGGKIVPLTDAELATVTDLLKAVGLALNNVGLYTAKHRIAFMSLEQAHKLLDDYLAMRKELNLSFPDEQLLVEATPLEIKNPLITNLKSQIKKWKVDSLSFKAGVNQDELLSLLEILNLRPDREMAELGTLLIQKRVNHVQVNKAVFIKADEAGAKGEGGGGEKRKRGPKEIVIDEEKLSNFLLGLVKTTVKVKDSVMAKMEKKPEELAKEIMESVQVKYEQEQDPDIIAEELSNLLDRIGEILEKEAYEGKEKNRGQLVGLFQSLEKALLQQIGADKILDRKKEAVTNKSTLRLAKIKVGIIAAEFEKRKKTFEELVEFTKNLLTNEEENKRIVPLLKTRLTLEGMSEESFREMLEKAGLRPKDKEDRLRDIQESIQQAVQGAVLEKVEGTAAEEIQSKIMENIKGLINSQVELQTKELRVENEVMHHRVDKMDSILKSVADAIVVVDPSGQVVFVNPAAEKLLGTPKEKLIGKHVLDKMGENQMIALSKDSMGEQGVFEPTEVEVRGTRDAVKTLRQSVGVIHNKDGQTVGTVSVLSDVTKQKEINQLKSDFVANISHELRTPLVSIQKSIELLVTKETGSINPDQERFLQICNRNVSRLMRLINDVLDISKIEAGKMRLNVQSVDVQKLVREAIASMFGWAQSKNIALETKFEEPIPHSLWDYDKVIQVLTNFLSNAVKYTDEKGVIEVSVKCVKGPSALEGIPGRAIPMSYGERAPREPLDEYILITVTDNGAGMSQENVDKIFDKFFQIQHTSGEKIMGTGLGLPIAREIVQMHHGKIWVSSKLKQGSTFVTALPVRDNSLIFA